MTHTVILNKGGYIEHNYDRYITLGNMDRIIEQTKKYVIELQKAGKPIKVLTDLSILERVPLDARKKAFDSMRTIPYDKIAVFGGSVAQHNIVKLFAFATKAINAHAQMRHFDNREAAVAWLKEKN